MIKNVHQLKILTYNIWFDQYELVKRMKGLSTILKQEKPHVFGLQEVTLPAYNILQQYCATFFNEYQISPAGNPASYYTMLFIHKSLNCIQFRRINFNNSMQGRDIIIAAVLVKTMYGEIKCTFATSHLESLWTNRKQRGQQFEAALQILTEKKQGSSECIYFGDMNMTKNEAIKYIEQYNQHNPNELQDAWLALGHNHKDGFTYNTAINNMSKFAIRKSHHKNTRVYRERLDRFFIRNRHFQLSTINIIGNKKIEENIHNKKYIFPSDHFGLTLTLKLNYVK